MCLIGANILLTVASVRWQDVDRYHRTDFGYVPRSKLGIALLISGFSFASADPRRSEPDETLVSPIARPHP